MATGLRQRSPASFDVHVKPPRDHFEPVVARARACVFTAVSPAQTTVARPRGPIWKPVRSSRHVRFSFGFRPLRMSQRRYVPPSLGSALKTQPMLELGIRNCVTIAPERRREAQEGDEDRAHGCMLGPG